MIKEKVLLAKLKSKDKQAFAEVYDLFVDKIYRFVYFKVNNQAEAEDLTSSIFLKAWNHIQQNSVSDYKTLPSLIYTIARNTVIDYYRKVSREEISSYENNPEALNVIDESHNIGKKLLLDEEMSNITDKLSLLKDEYREAIILRYIDELSINEIAIILNKSRGNARVLCFRALSALKELVEKN